MEGIGAEVRQKIRSAIKAKLMEIGVYVDEELPDYIMVMVVNKRTKEEMDDELQLFLGSHTPLFTAWLHQVLQKLQEVTVGNLGPGGIKRKIGENFKKKKKSKLDLEKKEIRKKIKVEPEDIEENKITLKNKEHEKEKKKSTSEDVNESSSKINELVENKKKEKTDSKPEKERTNNISIINKQNESTSQESIETCHNPEEEQRVARRSMSPSTTSQAGDLDDDDCINIRTDGELLDTAEEINLEDLSRKTKDKDPDNSKTIDKKRTTFRRSSPRQKEKVKPEDCNTDRASVKEAVRKHSPTPPRSSEKVVDARELLNRKKAAKQSDSRVRSRSREKSWSTSPPRRRRDDDRDNQRFREDRENRRVSREREQSHRRVSRTERRERKGTRDRDMYSSKYRDDDRSSRRDLDSRESRKRDSSDEPPPKRSALERPSTNKVNEWECNRSSKANSSSEVSKVKMDSPVRKRNLEVPAKRSGLVSRVVARPQEPEDAVDTPLPSVVKVTPRPRRHPSQQASSNLIIKAISEANKSLASLPPRPDSTQRTRQEPVFTRTLRQPKRIPPEKIAISITNPLALESADTLDEKYNKNAPPSPQDDANSNQSTQNNIEAPPSSPEPEEPVQNEVNPSKKWNNEENMKTKTEPLQTIEEPEIELGLEPYDEIEDASDPQFVVTLNGYDPDGLFSGEEGDNDEWLKETVDEEPLLTSTPDQMSPQSNRISSPVMFKNAPTVNHSNLIEVELVKTKNTERCKYWPACKLAEKCTFYHPTKPCKIFPACKFGDACLYIHPQCKYNALCTRKGCVFAHTPTHTPLQPAAMPKVKYAAVAPQPCKYYPNCTNINCPFTHPSRACRFGLYCTKKDCVFNHGQVAPVDKLKWTRVTTT